MMPIQTPLITMQGTGDFTPPTNPQEASVPEETAPQDNAPISVDGDLPTQSQAELEAIGKRVGEAHQVVE